MSSPYHEANGWFGLLGRTGQVARCCVALICCALWPSVVLAEEPAARANVVDKVMQIERQDQTFSLTFDATEFGDEEMETKLRSGLPQDLIVRAFVYPVRGGTPLAVTVQSCHVVYDLWQAVFRVDVEGPTKTRNLEFGTPGQVLQTCLRLDHLRFGGDELQRARGERVYCAVLIELNPISQATLERIRRWLSRPSSGGPLRGDAFFGSFVSIFVGRDIGRAERSGAFRSQSWVVP